MIFVLIMFFTFDDYGGATQGGGLGVNGSKKGKLKQGHTIVKN